MAGCILFKANQEDNRRENYVQIDWMEGCDTIQPLLELPMQHFCLLGLLLDGNQLLTVVVHPIIIAFPERNMTQICSNTIT